MRSVARRKPAHGWRRPRAWPTPCRSTISPPAGWRSGRLAAISGGCSAGFGKAFFPKGLRLTAPGRSGSLGSNDGNRSVGCFRPGIHRSSIGARYWIMTKSELIAELATANPHLTARDVELIVVTVFDEITGALARGERVEL